MIPLLVTIGTDENYGGMVKDSEPRHRAYASRWGYEYIQADPSIAVRDMFGRMDYIIRYMDSGKYSHIFWLDADCLVADFSHDMRETLPPWAWLGLIIHTTPSRQDIWHFQTGMMYWRVNQESRDFLTEVMKHRYDFPGDSGWHDQEVMNMLLHTDPRWQAGLNILNYRWNCNLHDSTPRHHPIVAAWHGACHPVERRLRMQQYDREHPY